MVVHATNLKLRKGLTIKTYNDHRMAMSFAPLAMCFGKLIITDVDVVKKSYPTFWEELQKVGFTINLLTDSNNLSQNL